MGSPSSVRTTQPTCATPIVQMYLRAAGARAGSFRATSDQRKSMDSRITTYPSTRQPDHQMKPLSSP